MYTVLGCGPQFKKLASFFSIPSFKASGVMNRRFSGLPTVTMKQIIGIRSAVLTVMI
jgi:hypothetical protein